MQTVGTRRSSALPAASPGRGVAVVGVDLPAYRRGLAASDDGCHYLISEVEDLSKRVQREFGFSGLSVAHPRRHRRGRHARLCRAGAVARGDSRRRNQHRSVAVAHHHRAAVRRRAERAGAGRRVSLRMRQRVYRVGGRCRRPMPCRRRCADWRRPSPATAHQPTGCSHCCALALPQRRRRTSAARSPTSHSSSSPPRRPGAAMAVIYSGRRRLARPRQDYRRDAGGRRHAGRRCRQPALLLARQDAR